MPVHDWSRVIAGNFHDFHQSWIVAIRNALNNGLLPNGFYALAEQHAAGPIPDVFALERSDPHDSTAPDLANPGDAPGNGGTLLAVEQQPPQVSFVESIERNIYAEKADRVAVYHANGDRVVAYVEIVSVGNKHTEAPLSSFCDKLDEALESGCHLLVIDLHRPGKHDPHGLHYAFWESRHGEAHAVSREKPLGLSAYHNRLFDDRVIPTAYFEPVGLGQALPDMPLFLTSQHYIYVPLEQTYMEAWKGVPERWKRVIEEESAS